MAKNFNKSEYAINKYSSAMHEKDFPTLHIGSRIVVPKQKLIEWIEQRIAL